MTDPQVVVGAVGKPFGLRGEVYVHPDPDIGHGFPSGKQYQSDKGVLTCASSRLHSGHRLVVFEGVDDREDAEALRGAVLSIPRGEVELEDGAYWVDDLLGAEVRDENGAPVGIVERVEDGPAHDLLVIARPDGGEALVPAVDEFFSFEDGVVVLRSIPGLLDLDEADDS